MEIKSNIYGYVVNITQFGLNSDYGIFCGTHRYIACGRQIPVTTKNSFQEPKIYKSIKNADRALLKLKSKYGYEHLHGIVEEFVE